MTTLAEKLRANNQAKGERLGLSPKQMEDRASLQEFFDKARDKFIEAISNGSSSKEAAILVGMSPSKSDNTAIATMISSYMSGGGQKAVECQLSMSTAFSAPWKSFCDWARSEGLKPKWTWNHCGGGLHSWYLLTVESLV